MKPLRLVGSSLNDLRDFPAEARRQTGFELHAIQRGLDPSDWKPIPDVGPGAREIRIHVLGEWRVLYVAKFGDAVYVLHAFRKKTQKTLREDVELARQRYLRSRNDQRVHQLQALIALWRVVFTVCRIPSDKVHYVPIAVSIYALSEINHACNQ